MASSELRAQLELLAGDPELVIVDARALRLLLGGVAELLILERVGEGMIVAGTRGRALRSTLEDDDSYVWDEDELCP